MSIATELQNLNDNILDAYDAVQDKGGTVPANKNMVNLPTAIDSIPSGSGEYDIRRTMNASGSDNKLSVSYLQEYVVPDDINVIDTYALAYAYVEPGGVDSVDLNNVREIKTRGMDHFAWRSGSALQTTSIKAEKLTTVGSYAFSNAFLLYAGNTIEFPEVTSVSTYAFQRAFYNIRSRSSSSHCAVNFPKLTSCGNYAFSNCFWVTTGDIYDGIGSASFPELTTAGDQAFESAFYSNGSLLSVDFSSLQSVGNSTFKQAFYGCSRLSALSFPELTAAGNNAFQDCFSIGSAQVPATVSFPKLATIGTGCFNGAFKWSGVKTLSFPEITSAPDSSFGSLFYYSATSGSFDAQKVSFPKLATAGKNVFQYAFAYQTVISTVGGTGSDIEFPVLSTAGQGCFNNMLSHCSSLTSLSFPELAQVDGPQAFAYMCDGCASLTSAVFPSLSNIAQSNVFYYTFRGCTALTSVSFPALATDSFGTRTDQFRYMLQGCTGVTVHFPAAIQSTIGSWSDVTNGFGGTNTTVLFDL